MRTTRRTTRRALRKLIERRSTGGDAVTSPKRTAALALTTVAQRHLARGPDGFVRGVAWRGVAWRGVAWRGVMVSTHGPRSVSFFIPYRVPYVVTRGLCTTVVPCEFRTAPRRPLPHTHAQADTSGPTPRPDRACSVFGVRSVTVTGIRIGHFVNQISASK